MKIERSCGVVTFTEVNGTIKYVIVHQNNGEYSFPKGHMEPGETERETALREVFEEVGLVPELIDGFETTETAPIPNVDDVIFFRNYYLGRYEDQEIVYPKNEVQNALLVTYEEAMELFTVGSSKRVLTQANNFLKVHTV